MRKKRALNEFEFVEKKDNGKAQEELGKGAFGRVRLAHDKVTDTKVAIKTIPKKLLKENAQAENIKREIKLHRKLDHPHIVKLYHSLEDETNVYLVLEYVPMGNLFVYLKKRKTLEEQEAFVYFLQTALALDYLHKKGIIHRDLKPENILLDAQGNIKICDFGWSAELQPERRTFCGTLDYMCPEMLNSQNHDHRVDIWAMGILLFEMLHGHAPYNKNRQSQEVVIKAILNAATTKIPFNDKISNDAKDLIQALLKVNPLDRLSMEEIFNHKWIKVHARALQINIPEFVYEKGVNETVQSIQDISIDFGNLTQPSNNYQSQKIPSKQPGIQQRQENPNFYSQQLPSSSPSLNNSTYQQQQQQQQHQQQQHQQQSTTPNKKPSFDQLFQSTHSNTNNPPLPQYESTSKSPTRLTPEQQRQKNELLGINQMETSKQMEQSNRINYQMQQSQDMQRSQMRDQSPNQSMMNSNYQGVSPNKPGVSPNSRKPILNDKMAQSQMIINKYTQQSNNQSGMFKSQDIANQQPQQSDEFTKYMQQEQERKRKEEEFRKQQLADLQKREEQRLLEEQREREERQKQEELERSRRLREQELENQRKIKEFEEEQKRLREQEKLRKQREQEEFLQRQREQEQEKQRKEKDEQDRLRKEQLRREQEDRDRKVKEQEEQRRREEQVKREQEERQRREQEKWEQEQRERLRKEKEEQDKRRQSEEQQQEKLKQQERQKQQYEEQLRLQKQQEQDRKLREYEEQKKQLNRSNSRNVRSQETEEDKQAQKLKELEQKARQEYQQHLINQSNSSYASKQISESKQQRRQISDDDLFIATNNNSYIPQKQKNEMNEDEYELEQKLHNMLVQNLQLELPPITKTLKPDENSNLDWDISVIEQQQKQTPLMKQYENIQQVEVAMHQIPQNNKSLSPNTRQTRFTPRVTKMEDRPTHINNMLDDQLDEWDLSEDPQVKLLNQLLEQPERQKKEKQKQNVNTSSNNGYSSQSQQQISVSTQPTNKFSFGESKAKQTFKPETIENVEESFRQDRSMRMNTSRDRSRNKIPAKSNPKYRQIQQEQEPVEEQYDEDQLEDLKRSKSSNQENTYDQKLKQFKKYDHNPYSDNYQNQTQEQYKPRKSRISERQNRTIPQRPLQEMDFFDRLKFAFGCLSRRQ